MVAYAQARAERAELFGTVSDPARLLPAAAFRLQTNSYSAEHGRSNGGVMGAGRGPNGPCHASPPGPDSGLGQGAFGVQRENGSGYAQQWNLVLQGAIRSKWSASVGYAGSKLTRLGVADTNLNQLSVEDLSLGAQLTVPVANPFLGEIPAGGSLGRPTVARQQLLRRYPRLTAVAPCCDNVGSSPYQSLQARLQRRLSAGLPFASGIVWQRRGGAPHFTLGSASRNPERRSIYRSADPMVGKVIAFTDRLRAELRAEALNTGNTPPPGQPNGRFGAAAFGAVTTAGDPRVLGLTARLKF